MAAAYEDTLDEARATRQVIDRRLDELSDIVLDELTEIERNTHLLRVRALAILWLRLVPAIAVAMKDGFRDEDLRDFIFSSETLDQTPVPPKE